MKLLKHICNELGVELEKEWAGTDGNHYLIQLNGQLIRLVYTDNLEEDVFYRADSIERVLTGSLRPVWKPKINEVCYRVSFESVDNYVAFDWTESPEHIRAFEKGLVFKSKEEAVSVAEKILAYVRRVYGNETGN